MTMRRVLANASRLTEIRLDAATQEFGEDFARGMPLTFSDAKELLHTRCMDFELAEQPVPSHLEIAVKYATAFDRLARKEYVESLRALQNDPRFMCLTTSSSSSGTAAANGGKAFTEWELVTIVNLHINELEECCTLLPMIKHRLAEGVISEDMINDLLREINQLCSQVV